MRATTAGSGGLWISRTFEERHLSSTGPGTPKAGSPSLPPKVIYAGTAWGAYCVKMPGVLQFLAFGPVQAFRCRSCVSRSIATIRKCGSFLSHIYHATAATSSYFFIAYHLLMKNLPHAHFKPSVIPHTGGLPRAVADRHRAPRSTEPPDTPGFLLSPDPSSALHRPEECR